MATTVQDDQLTRQISAMRAHLGQAGDGAKASFGVDTTLVEGFRVEARIRQFTLTIDEPAGLGGTDLGPNPVEVVLAALGACQEIVYATYSRILGIPIESVSVRAEGTLDPRGFFGLADVPVGFSGVSYAVDIKSPAPAEEVRRLIATAVAHCPVLEILKRPVPVDGKYAHNGAPLAIG